MMAETLGAVLFVQMPVKEIIVASVISVEIHVVLCSSTPAEITQ